MVLGITNVEPTVGVDADAMRPGEPTARRVAVRSVVWRAVAEHGVDHAAGQVDPANCMAFGIGDEKLIARERNTFGSGQLRLARIGTVARIAKGAGAGDMARHTRLEIETNHRVSFPERHIHGPGRVDGERSRTVQRCSFNDCPIRRRALLAGAGEGADRAVLEIDPAYPVIADVGDEQATALIELDAVRLNGVSTK